MFFTPILDIALTLVFLYFILSIISSAANEFIVNLFNLRSKNLKSAIENLLYDDSWKKISASIINSPFIKALQKNMKIFPSNISPTVFSSAFIHAVEDAYNISITFTGDRPQLPKELENTETGNLIKSIISNAEGNVQKVKDYLEDYFNSAMSELTTVYRKYVKYFSFLFAFALSIVLNIDTINIANNLWHNPAAREQTAAQISSVIDQNKNFFSSVKIDSTKIDSTNHKAVMTAIDSINANITKIGKADSLLTALPLPIGWEAGNYPVKNSGFLSWLVKLIGILITSVAIMMGAPFWFDVLNKIAGLKASMKKE